MLMAGLSVWRQNSFYVQNLKWIMVYSNKLFNCYASGNFSTAIGLPFAAGGGTKQKQVVVLQQQMGDNTTASGFASTAMG